METVQIVLDKWLLRAADKAARRTKRNRSALVRDAVREHLRRLAVRDLEERDRAGYSRQRRTQDKASAWEAEAVWPAEEAGATSGFTSSLRQTRSDKWSF